MIGRRLAVQVIVPLLGGARDHSWAAFLSNEHGSWQVTVRGWPYTPAGMARKFGPSAVVDAQGNTEAARLARSAGYPVG